MKILFLIGTGSFVGGICRYLLGQLIQSRFSAVFPFGTLAVNILGCFAIGLLFSLSEKNLSEEWKAFLMLGLCGGFTTFSAFSVESVSLLSSGQYASAFAYISMSVLLSLVACFGGIVLIRSVY